MNIVLDIDKVDCNNIFIDNKTKNTIIDEGIFYKLHYSNHVLSMSNIIIKLNINIFTALKNYHRYKCIFSTDKYQTIIDKVSMLEKNILLELYKNRNNKNRNNNDSYKQPNYNVSTLLRSGCFKLSKYSGCDNNIALKISGIWETESNYGLTYKFIALS